MAKTSSSQQSIKPLSGYILIAPVDSQSSTVSGIILPESAQEKPAQGKVVAVGDDNVISGMVIKAPVKVGDIVIYKKWGGDEIKLGGMEYKLVRFDDLMAIVEGEK